nr:MAG TPA: hypothetical protein [Caudoviricetes sp.]
MFLRTHARKYHYGSWEKTTEEVTLLNTQKGAEFYGP